MVPTTKVYITHCCARKNGSLRGTDERVKPDKLYVAKPTKRFMETCKNNSVVWAIFSDEYGVWFSDVEHEWYEKDPDSVSEAEFIELLRDFDSKLESFEEIWFYHNPGRFHPLYARLLEATRLRDKVKKFSHLMQIGRGGPQMKEGPAEDVKRLNSGSPYQGARVSLTAAARLLNELRICKAFRSSGEINGPNCYRFGHRDTESGHWYWEVNDLILEARKRNSALPEVIRQVEEQYSSYVGPPIQRPESSRSVKAAASSRADLEKRFRDTVVGLELAMRGKMPLSQTGRDLRTLGILIREAEDRELLKRVHLKEARFVNEVRNAQNHPTTEQNSNEDLSRAIQSAHAIIAALENR